MPEVMQAESRPVRQKPRAHGETPPNPALPVRWHQPGDPAPDPPEQRRERIDGHRLHGDDHRAAYIERQPHGHQLLTRLIDGAKGSPQDARTLSVLLWRYWTGWEQGRVAALLDDASPLLRQLHDPRIIDVPDRRDAFVKRVADVAARLHAGVEAGLAARLDTYLEHGLMPGGSPELAFYKSVCFVRDLVDSVGAALGYEPPPRPARVRVCPSCAAVFEPHRPNHERCRQCCHKPAAPAFRELGAAFRVARYVPGTRIVAGWETARIKSCATCGEPFLARDDKERHCEGCRR